MTEKIIKYQLKFLTSFKFTSCLLTDLPGSLSDDIDKNKYKDFKCTNKYTIVEGKSVILMYS